eukprot:gene19830-21771_t
MAAFNTEVQDEEYPDVLPDPGSLSKRWIWKEELATLEQVHTGVNMGDKNAMNLTKSKKTKGANNVRFPDMQKMSQKAIKKNQASFGSRAKNSTSPCPSTKFNRVDKKVISLQDLKNVAYDLLSDDVIEVPMPFQQCLGSEEFDNFLMILLFYFEAFFERRTLENKPRPMATEPSLAEKEAISSVISKQKAAQRLLASKYCTLLLGLGNAEQHHMACGKQRKSYTRKDRSLYETLYSFCSYAVWVCFRRRDIELISQELGRQFRSDTFNPASRPTDSNDFKLASDLTKQDDPDFNLAPYSIRHRQIGIIGESISGFNPVTLAPFGDEHEEEEEEEGEQENRT